MPREGSGEATNLTMADTIHPNTSQRVQRGTKRPSGKRQNRGTNPVVARIKITDPRVGMTGFAPAPSITRKSETNSAIRSSDRRQKISPPTAKKTYPKTAKLMVVYPA